MARIPKLKYVITTFKLMILKNIYNAMNNSVII